MKPIEKCYLAPLKLLILPRPLKTEGLMATPKFWFGDAVVIDGNPAMVYGVELRTKLGWWYKVRFLEKQGEEYCSEDKLEKYS